MDAKQSKAKLILILSLVLNLLLLSMIIYVKKNSVSAIVSKFFTKPSIVSEQDIAPINSQLYASKIRSIGDNFKTEKRVLFLGNSITLHGASKELGWNHVSGMAASSEEKDYVHVLVRLLSEDWKAKIQYQVVNIADFERGYTNFNYDSLALIKSFHPDLVVFQVGEYVLSESINQDGDHFRSSYSKLVSSIESKNKIICLPFWPDKEKNRIITQVALDTGASIVDLSHLGSGLDPLNMARSEHKYKHAGVSAHPGDYGMENIAKVIFSVARNLDE